MNPTIGIILDHEPPGSYSKFPWYALRENYFSAFKGTGAACVAVPYNFEAVDTYIEKLDGILIPGGNFDVNPSLYGEDSVHDKVTTRDHRTQFEFAITEKALKANKPVLGICGGHQLLNVVLGGTLIQHIPDEIETDLNHEQPNPRDEPYHKVSVLEETLLKKIVGVDEMFVNSAHHQAIRDIGNDLMVNSYASDGVIEGVESKIHKYCLGLQWHPEFLIDPGDYKIMQSFVEVCRG